MFETLDIMISLGVVFLILSMVHKYLMSMIKRLLKVKASVIAGEMKTFIGEKTSTYLIPYIQKKAKHLNFLEETRNKTGLIKGETGLRQLNKEQLKDVVEDLRDFFNSNTVNVINDELGLSINQTAIDEAIAHLGKLKGRIEHMYDNTVEKISEMYESRLRTFTFVCGLILAVVINADFFSIYGTLSMDTFSREKLIAGVETLNGKVTEINTKLESQEAIEDIKQELRGAEKDITDLTGNLKEAGLLLGWTSNKFSDAFNAFDSGFNKVIGLFISGLLISFGAPFWNDFLSSFIGIRKSLRGKEEGGANAAAKKGLRIP